MYIGSWGFPGGLDGNESACNDGDLGVISSSERSPGEWKSDILQYSCRESSMGREAWWSLYKYHLRIVAIVRASLIAQSVKNPPAVQETWFDSWGRKIYWRRDRLPTPVFLDSLVAQLVKNLPAEWETWVQSLDWEDLLEKGKVQSCLTLCDPMDCSMPGFPVLYYLLEFAQTHVH